MKIAVIIITKNTNLNPLLLASVKFADEIVVVADTNKKGSLISTKKIKYLYHPLGNDFSAQRNFALSQTNADWVLFVDDDEYVGTELGLEIQKAVTNTRYSGFMIPRIDIVFHRPLLHGETGKTKLLRLAKKDSGKFVRPVHEVWKIKGRVGEIRSPLYHLKDNMVSDFIGRMSHYSFLDSKILTKENKPFTWFRLLFYPVAKFKLNYFFRGGFLDGTAGLFQAFLMSAQSLTVRVFQWENLK